MRRLGDDVREYDRGRALANRFCESLVERAVAPLGAVRAPLRPAERDVFRAIDLERHPGIGFVSRIPLHLEPVATHPTRLAGNTDASTLRRTIVALVGMTVRHLDRMEEGDNLPRIVEVLEVLETTEVVVRNVLIVHRFFSERLRVVLVLARSRESELRRSL